MNAPVRNVTAGAAAREGADGQVRTVDTPAVTPDGRSGGTGGLAPAPAYMAVVHELLESGRHQATCNRCGRKFEARTRNRLSFQLHAHLPCVDPPFDWEHEDHRCIPVHLLLTPEALNIAIAALEHPNQAVFVQDIGREIRRQVSKGDHQ
jgi:hypothetical protein